MVHLKSVNNSLPLLHKVVLQVGANETKSIVFTAPKAGEYDFHCNIPGHEKEAGKMIVK